LLQRALSLWGQRRELVRALAQQPWQHPVAWPDVGGIREKLGRKPVVTAPRAPLDHRDPRVRRAGTWDRRKALCRWSIAHECDSNARALQQPQWRSLVSVQRSIGQSVRPPSGEYSIRRTDLA